MCIEWDKDITIIKKSKMREYVHLKKEEGIGIIEFFILNQIHYQDIIFVKGHH